MSGVTNKLMSSAGAGAAAFTVIEDVFSTYLYTGNSSTQTITNGIDLAGEGGMVWLKTRSSVTSHALFDTERGVSNKLSSDTTGAASTSFTGVSAFNSDGFSLGSIYNTSPVNYASWTFRKAPRFFDVVTYTGTGAAQTIAHNLGVAPGCIIIKRTDSTGNWPVYHRGLNGGINPENSFLNLNLTTAIGTSANYWNNTAPTETNFTVGIFAALNASGGTYVAYLFAHDPLGPSGDGSDGLIACGSYTGNGSATGTVVDLGWEPQWLLIKRSDSTGDWNLIDNMRGFTVGTTDAELNPNLSNAESTGTFVSPTATGFQLNTTDAGYNASGGNYIYIAIRRGPMRAPESGTEVFAVDTKGSVNTAEPGFRSPFAVDAALFRRTTVTFNMELISRMTAPLRLFTNLTSAEASNMNNTMDYSNGWYMNTSADTSYRSWMFRRAPGFFDVVCYDGNDTAGNTINHNLGVVPEMMIFKGRNANLEWVVYHKGLDGGNQPETHYLWLDSTNAEADSIGYFNDTAPTSDTITLGSGARTNDADGMIAYLFATLPGVSKVGSYTGNGTSQTIDCGFTTGARFILIKRTDSTGDWYVWDTARGIVTGNDPHLSLNTTAAQVTTNDSVDPASVGFIVNQASATNINVNAASYIFYAIA